MYYPLSLYPHSLHQAQVALSSEGTELAEYTNSVCLNTICTTEFQSDCVQFNTIQQIFRGNFITAKDYGKGNKACQRLFISQRVCDPVWEWE